jgi:hypothetical protein
MMYHIINMSKVNNEMQTPAISVITISVHVFTTKMGILQATNCQVQQITLAGFHIHKWSETSLT